MTTQDIILIADRNKQFKSEGRYEGAAAALFGAFLFLILAAVLLN